MGARGGWGGIMGLFSFFQRGGLLGEITKNAHVQYEKAKRMIGPPQDERLTEIFGHICSEEEIPSILFYFRYVLGPERRGGDEKAFTRKERDRLSRYFNTQFMPFSLYEFCLASLDIEGNISPADGTLWLDCCMKLHIQLVEYGHEETSPPRRFLEWWSYMDKTCRGEDASPLVYSSMLSKEQFLIQSRHMLGEDFNMEEAEGAWAGLQKMKNMRLDQELDDSKCPFF